MKYLNIAFVALFTLCMISCGGEKSKTTPEENIESMELEDTDEIVVEEIDETQYLEAAMNALENGDTELATTEIMNAVKSIKSYMGEIDDPSMAMTAIKELTKVVTALKSGVTMTTDDLKKTIMSLELFSEELDIDEEMIDQEEIDEELES